MSDLYLRQNQIIGFKAESTAGTYNAPLAADFDIVLSEVSGELDPRMTRRSKEATGNMKMPQSTSSMRTIALTGKNELRYSGDETVAPAVYKLLSVCGLQVTENGTDAVTVNYAGIAGCSTLSAVISDITCGTTPVSIDQKVSGIQGNVVLSCAGVGEPYMLEFSMNGADAGEIDNASPIKAITGADTGAIEQFLGTAFSLDGVTAYKIISFSIDFGMSAVPVPDASRDDSGGVAQYQVTSSDPKATIVVQKLPVATSGLKAALIANTEFSSLILTGTHFDISITASNLSALKNEDGDGIVNQSLELEVRDFTMTQKD